METGTVASSTFASSSTAPTGGATYSISEPMAATGTFTFRVTLPAQNGRRPVSSAPFTVNVYRANVAVCPIDHAGLHHDQEHRQRPLGHGWMDPEEQRRHRSDAAGPDGCAERNAEDRHRKSGSSTASVVYLGAGQMFANLHDDIKLFDGPLPRAAPPVLAANAARDGSIGRAVTLPSV